MWSGAKIKENQTKKKYLGNKTIEKSREQTQNLS